MKRTMSNEGKVRAMIAKIYVGWTIAMAATFVGLSEGYAYQLLKKHYKSETAYKKLLAKNRENLRAIREAEELCKLETEMQESVNEVIVVETGYLMTKGVTGILDESLDIYIPSFNLRELDRLANSYAVAKELLNLIHSCGRVTPVNLSREEEILGVDPDFPVRNRTKGVVAVCCYLWSRGYKVRLLTNSSEIRDVAEAQDIGIDIIKAES